MATRLKVFVTSDGFTDYVVAASSRPKALAAWGVRQDVFKEGQAHETDDPALTEAALAEPGVVLRRPAGSRADLARLQRKAGPRRAASDLAARRKVEALERRLDALVAKQARVLEKLEAERAALEARVADLKAAQARARQALEDDLSAARRARG